MHCAQCALCSVHCTLYNIQSLCSVHSGQSSSQDDSVIDKAEILFSRVRSVTTEHLCNVKFNVHELRWISSALLPKHWFCVYAGPVHVRGVVAVWSCDGFVEQHSDGAASAAVLLTVQRGVYGVLCSIVQYCAVSCSVAAYMEELRWRNSSFNHNKSNLQARGLQ